MNQSKKPFREQQIYHLIKPRDSLSWLAKMYNTSIDDIINSNPGLNPHRLHVGAKIIIHPNKTSVRKAVIHEPEPHKPAPIQKSVVKENQAAEEKKQQETSQTLSSSTPKIPVTSQNTEPSEHTLPYQFLDNFSPDFNYGNDLNTIEYKTTYPKTIKAADLMEKPDKVKDTANLMMDFLKLSSELITAICSGQNEKIQISSHKWIAGAEIVMRSLYTMDPHANDSELHDRMARYLDTVSKEVTDCLTNHFKL